MYFLIQLLILNTGCVNYRCITIVRVVSLTTVSPVTRPE